MPEWASVALILLGVLVFACLAIFCIGGSFMLLVALMDMWEERQETKQKRSRR